MTERDQEDKEGLCFLCSPGTLLFTEFSTNYFECNQFDSNTQLIKLFSKKIVWVAILRWYRRYGNQKGISRRWSA